MNNKLPVRYWLVKSEPGSYSIDNLKRDKKTGWAGVRNYQARNFMRDFMKIGDLVLFYHSNSKETGIFGIAKVVSGPKLDPSSLDSKDDHFDLSAVKRENEIKKGKREKNDHIWIMVDLQFVSKFKKYVSLGEMRIDPNLSGMVLLRKGMRLSVQPVSEREFKYIEKLGTSS